MNKWLIILLIFLFSTILRLWNLNQMGRTWDEAAYVEMGYEFIELIKKGDFTNSYWYKTSDAPPLARYLYGFVGQFDISYLSKDGKVVFRYDYTFARLVSVILSSLSVVIVILIGWKYISPFVGMVAGLILATLPLFLGFSQLATLESFIMFFFTISVYYFLGFLEDLSLKKMVIVGVLVGLSLLTKYTNILVLPLFMWIYLLWYFYVGRKKGYKMFNSKLVGIFLVAFFTFFLLWPMPWFHLEEVINLNYKLRIIGSEYSVPEVFFGKLMLVPKVYYLTQFLITTPFLIVILFLIGLKVISDIGFKHSSKNISLKWILYVIVAWFCLPFIQSLYNFRQHGIRYIIEIYAPLSLIAAIGFNFLVAKVSKNTWVKMSGVIMLCAYMLLIIIKISPYYLDYFNIVVGGTKNVYEKQLFQLGWWGQGIREAGLYVIKNARRGSSVGLALSPIHSAPPMPMLNVQIYDDHKKYDYVIVNFYNVLREGFDDSLIRNNYTPVYFVKADKAILATVYKLK